MSFPSTEQNPECPNKLDLSGNLLYQGTVIGCMERKM